MDNFDELKNIWQQMPAQSLPSVQEINQRARAYQRSTRRKYVISILYMVVTLVVIASIGYFIEPVYVTTRIGVVIIIIAIVLTIVSQSQLLSILSRRESVELDSRHYLQQLIEYRKRTQRVQTTILSLYFLLLVIGLGLYMFEYVMKMTLSYQIVTVLLTTSWIALNWFYLRPLQIRKKNAKTNEIISQLENFRPT